MTFQKIASTLAKREGKKSQARIGDIRELLKSLVDWSSETIDNTEDPLAYLCERAGAKERTRIKKESGK